jgi:hypothetical protein
MPDIPNTRFYNFVDTPALIQYTQFGEASVQLDPQAGSIIDVSQFRQVSFLIGSTSASSSRLFLGKISNRTLANSFTRPINHQVHTFDIIGPEMALDLQGGPPSSSEQVQLWVYLRS